MTNSKDNRNSQVFESLALLAPSQPAVSDKERKKFEDEKSKLYTQLDEKVRKWLIYRYLRKKALKCFIKFLKHLKGYKSMLHCMGRLCYFQLGLSFRFLKSCVEILFHL